MDPSVLHRKERSVPDPSLGVLLFLPYRHLEQRVLDAVVGAGYFLLKTGK